MSDNATSNANASVGGPTMYICPVCGKTYPLDKRNAFYSHVHRHKKKSFQKVVQSGEQLQGNVVSGDSSGAPDGPSPSGGGVERVDTIPASEMGTEGKAAGLTEIPPVGGAVESAGGEEKAYVGLHNIGRIVSSFYRGLFSRAGLEDLDKDEINEIERTFSNENLNVPASPKVAAAVDLATALAAPVAKRAPAIIEKFKSRSKSSALKAPAFSTPPAPAAGADHAGARGAPPEPTTPQSANEGGGTTYQGGTSPYPPTEPDLHTLPGTQSYEDELKAAQARYQKIMEQMHITGRE